MTDILRKVVQSRQIIAKQGSARILKHMPHHNLLPSKRWFNNRMARIAAIAVVLSALLLSPAVLGQDVDPSSPEDPSENPDLAEGLARYGAGLIDGLRGNSEGALDNFLQAAEADPNNKELSLQVAQGLLATGEPEDAKRALEILSKAVGAHIEDPDLRVMFGLANERVGNPDAAARAFREAWELNPENVPALANALRLDIVANTWATFFATLERASNRPDASNEFRAQIATLAIDFSGMPGMRSPERAKAIGDAIVDEFLENEFLETEILVQMAELCERTNDPEDVQKAITFYERAREEQPDWIQLTVKLALIYVRLNDEEKTKEEAERLINADPPNPFGHRALAYLAQANERFDEAVKHFENALDLDPNPDSYFELAAALINADQPEKATELLEEAGAQFEPSFSLYFYRGIAQLQQENYEDAFQFFKDAELIAKSKEPNRLDAFFYFRLGTTAERVKDYDATGEYLKRAIEIDPEFHEAMNYLGYTWADLDTNLDEARDLIERALSFQPENEAYLDSMAWVAYRLGDYEEALEAMEKAIENSELPDPIMYDHLGDIHFALGNVAEAENAWREALKHEPEPDLEAALNDKLGHGQDNDDPTDVSEPTQPKDSQSEEKNSEGAKSTDSAPEDSL